MSSATTLCVSLALGFAAGLMDYSLALGYDLVVVPTLVLMGVGIGVAIPTALLAQIAASVVYSVVMRRSVASRRGVAIVVCASLSAALFSAWSSMVPPEAIRWFLSALLLLTAATCIYSAWRGCDPLKHADRRLVAPMALAAGAAKGLVGCGFSAVMMFGQLILGVRLGSAVATTIASKIGPALMALIPRVSTGSIDPLLVSSILCGSLLAIPFATKLVDRVPRRAAYVSIAVYSSVVATLIAL